MESATRATFTVPPFWGSMLVMRDPLAFFSELALRGDVVRYRGVMTFWLVNDPALAASVLRRTNDVYDKRTILYRRLRDITGQGLLTSEGEHWRTQRRRMQPFFAPSRLGAYTPCMLDAARKVEARWRHIAREGRSIDLVEEMSRTTLEIVGATLFGADMASAIEDITDGFRSVSRYAGRPAVPVIGQMPWELVHTSLVRRRLLGRARQIIARRRRAPDAGDVLGALVQASDPPLTERDQLDEMLSFIVAGHETSAMALAWTFCELDRRPDVERALHAEVDRASDDDLAHPLERLGLTARVIEESMRLHPPVWIITRRLLAPERLGAHELPKGAMVIVLPYLLHRRPQAWPDPLRFDPERFTDKRGKPFYPFGFGPRVCLGGQFAMMEMVLLLGWLARRFRVRLAGAFPRELPSITLAPAGPVLARVEERQGDAR